MQHLQGRSAQHEVAMTNLSASPISVAIVEDQPEIREGLALLIGEAEGFRCTATFRSMEDALAGVADELPQVALIDIGLPGISGIEGIRILKERYPTINLVVLTVYDDNDRIFDALCAGASGYLLKKTPPPRLLESLREAVDGGSPMSPEIARRVIELFRRVRTPRKADYGLTPHETRILGMLVEGHNYRTAAARLGVSVNTVAFHIKHIYEKLQVHSKSEAVAKALRDGLLE
jgi:DNA-binding NarL/FixJ family response regulator